MITKQAVQALVNDRAKTKQEIARLDIAFFDWLHEKKDYESVRRAGDKFQLQVNLPPNDPDAQSKIVAAFKKAGWEVKLDNAGSTWTLKGIEYLAALDAPSSTSTPATTPVP